MFSEPVGRWPRKPSNDLPLITATALVSDPFRIRAIKSIVLKCISGAGTLFVHTADTITALSIVRNSCEHPALRLSASDHYVEYNALHYVIDSTAGRRETAAAASGIFVSRPIDRSIDRPPPNGKVNSRRG